MKAKEYTTLEAEMKKLKAGETLVAVWVEGNGYHLFIGDDIINHSWAVTEVELRQLQKLLNNKFKP